MKKNYLLLTFIIVVSFILVGCGKDKKNQENNNNVENNVVENNTEETNKEESQSQENKATDTQKVNMVYGFTVNGRTISLGDTYDSVKSYLGDEIKPAENVKPCGIELHGETKRYYYNDFTVEVNYQGKIYSLSISKFETPNTTAAFNGVKMFDSLDTLKSKLNGAPIKDENEYGLTYGEGNKYVSVTLTDENTVGFISMEDKSIEL